MKSKIFLSILLLSVSCNATVLTVNKNGPADFNSIQQAINNSQNGDTILISPGTYFENINLLGKNITLTSLEPNNPDDVNQTIIDGNDIGPVVTFTGTEDSNCVLAGLTITHGFFEGLIEGGGICGNNAHACIRKCNIIANHGHLYARSFGGGIANLHGNIEDCLIEYNYCHWGGGGLYNCDGQITNCSVQYNSVPVGPGGGLYECDGLISNCVIAHNHGDIWGGGLSGCNGTVINCLITNNSASHAEGGGLGLCNGSIINCTISLNHSQYSGGGLYNCDANIVNCIIWANIADIGADQISGSSIPTYSCIQDWTGGGTHNISSNPLFIDSDNGEFHFLPGSPCIDAGNNISIPSGIVTDLEGNNRFIDDPMTIDTGSGTSPLVDMGAYEYGSKIYNLTRQTYSRTIQDAVNSAQNNDEIILSPGIYAGTGNRDISLSNKSLTIRGTEPANENIVKKTIINCTANASSPARGFRVSSHQTDNSKIQGLTITEGYGPNETWEGTPRSAGGGVYFTNTNASIENCIYKNNDSNYWGGAIYFNGGSPSVKKCQFINNHTSETGGAIYTVNSNLTASNCLFFENSAGYGAGMYNMNSTNVKLINCTFNNNSASTIGGAMRNNASTVEITNCILWDNNSPEDNEIANNTSNVSISYSDIYWSMHYGPWNEQIGIDNGGNMDTDPLFANTSIGDLHLKSQAGRWDSVTGKWIKDNLTSPCVDTGNPSSDWKGELWPHGKRINSGAFGGTVQASLSLSNTGNIADLDKNGYVNYIDLFYLAENWLSNENLLSGDLNKNCSVNLCDFSVFAKNWLWAE